MHYLVYDLRTAQTELLSESGLDSTERAAVARRGKRYLLMRSLLKRELSGRTGEAPENIRFHYSAEGKPLYDRQPFNISHSGDLFCIAFHHSDVGVDIERMRPLRHMQQLARRIMCDAQYDAWLARGENCTEFFACWCAAEALAKLHADSIWHAQQRPFLWREGNRIQPLFSNAPRVSIFTPADGFQGAVAVNEFNSENG